MDPISAILGLVGTLGGGLMQMSGQQQANANNMMMNTGAWKAQQIAQEAGALGVSPLAILGGASGGNIPMQNVSGGAGNIGAAMGQNLSRAISASSTSDDRLQKLQVEHQQLVNAGLAQDLATKQGKAAVDAARASAQPPPVPAFQQYVDPRDPGHPWWARTKDYAESSFAGDPVQMIRGVGSSLEDTFPILKGLPTGWGLGARLHDFVTRPDVFRQADPLYPDW